ncbi:MAG: alpha/beta fold hydrolase, partial [Acidimicrobiales bacterium]
PLPRGLTIWAARAAFGRRPRAVDVELRRAMLDAMSPGPVAELVPHLLSFDVRERLGRVELPTTVIGGTRDVLTPPRTARAIENCIPGATLTLLEGCGHMVMLERVEELCEALR